MEKRYRIGVASYLNSRPLIHRLEETGNELVFDVPSKLTELLEMDQIDIGLIPSFGALSHSDFCILPDICISSDGIVQSVKLFSKLPPQMLQSVALDLSSQTSNALVQIILREKYQVSPMYTPYPPNLDEMLIDNDAALLIGDTCMQTDEEDLHVMDLGKEWMRFTGLPIVYAVWAVRKDMDLGNLPKQLSHARDFGVQNIDEVLNHTPNLPILRDEAKNYLQYTIHYTMGERDLAGLRKFQELAILNGLIERSSELSFYRE